MLEALRSPLKNELFFSQLFQFKNSFNPSSHRKERTNEISFLKLIFVQKQIDSICWFLNFYAL